MSRGDSTFFMPDETKLGAIMRQVAVGDRLWRTVRFRVGGRYRVSNDPLVDAERGGFVFRAVFGDDFCKGWRVFTPTERRMKGLVVIANCPVPIDWIYLEVTGLGKSGNVAFAKFVAGDQNDLLEAYVSPDTHEWSAKLDEAHASGEWV